MDAVSEDESESLEVLGTIRETCPTLRHIFLPDAIWRDFKAWHSTPDLVAAHRSMILLALERGHLKRLTSSIHRYLVDGAGVHPNVRDQYLKDLRERWMHYADPLERHHKSRIFMGRITELQVAEWLESRGWTITGLEALGGGPDIEARDPDGNVTAIEVKSIGTEDDDFKMILRSMAGEPAGGVVSPYSAINYLVFRIYEAAKQLSQFDLPRIALVVIGSGYWWRFKMQLEGGWIDWANAAFLDSGPAWQEFIGKQEERYPQLETELGAVVRGIHAVWILKRSSGYEYDLEMKLNPG